jgi:hypothetical protein
MRVKEFPARVQVKDDPPESQASPWATEPVPVATPLDARTFFGREPSREKVVTVIVRPRHRELLAAIREIYTPPPSPCVGCGRPYASNGALALAQSLSNTAAAASTWFCERCAEMDDEILLDVAEKSFNDALGGAYMRRAS